MSGLLSEARICFLNGLFDASKDPGLFVLFLLTEPGICYLKREILCRCTSLRIEKHLVQFVLYYFLTRILYTAGVGLEENFVRDIRFCD